MQNLTMNKSKSSDIVFVQWILLLLFELKLELNFY